MTVKNIGVNDKNVYGDVVEPDAQTSTNSYVVVTGSGLNASPFQTASYTISVITNNIDWKVFGANNSDFSDEVEVMSETTVSAGANDSYSVSPAPYRYYRVKIVSSSTDTHGDATIHGLAK
jgi:hypothetical protein